MGAWRDYSDGKYRLRQYRGRGAVVWYDEIAGTTERKRHRFQLRSTNEREARAEFDEYVRRLNLFNQTSETTIRDIWQLYYADRQLDGKRMNNFRQSWANLRLKFEHMPTDLVDAQMCRDYATDRFKLDNRSVSTIWTELQRLRSCINWGVKNKKIPYTSTCVIWVPKKPEGRKLVVNPAEFCQLLAECHTAHIKLFTILAACTAGRRGAICELQWPMIDFVARTIDLRIDEPDSPLVKKVAKGRALIHMNDLAHTALKEARELATTPYVIEWNSKPIKNPYRAFKRAVARAGLDARVSPHTIRHSVASWLEDENVMMQVISRYLGHSGEEITRKVYAKPSGTATEVAAQTVDSLISKMLDDGEAYAAHR